ncbi:hypothetical protein C4D60_Mb09t17100 [Musa balbisiana]|uniref:Uncharacterized protein n=1 Tax=Musa balbisiana TaxID=52838 RepID=A0A4S8IJI2_MUSBA|nr:hypothetical protein C4D60_Mb09t17100 [Musa balbisiana]
MWQVFAPGTEASAASSTAPPLLAFADNPSSESDSSRCSCDSFLKDAVDDEDVLASNKDAEQRMTGAASG